MSNLCARASMEEKLRFTGLNIVNPQHPQRIMSLSHVLPALCIVNMAGEAP
jgi:hypothetical protein